MRSLAGQRVLVTGASRGIGRAIAERFAAHGARVIVHARVRSDALMRETGAVLGVDGDLRDPELPSRLAEAAATLGGLDLLVLNAAVLGPMGPMDTIDLEIFGEVMRVNVDRQLAIFQALLPQLLGSRTSGRNGSEGPRSAVAESAGPVKHGPKDAAEAGASPSDTASAVIWLSSALGRIGVPGYGAYCASKHAVEGLSKLAHAEYGSRGLISVTVAPGMVQTDMLKAALGVDDVSQHTPPDQVGEAFARLFSVLSAEHSGMALEISDF